MLKTYLRLRENSYFVQPAQDCLRQRQRCERKFCFSTMGLLHDRDTKFCESFRELIESGSVKPIRLPARSPNLNSYAERWVRSVKEECLAKLILVGESSLRRALQQYLLHYHEERNHQGKENRILFPSQTKARRKEGAVRCRERLGGLLKYYEREAAYTTCMPRALTTMKLPPLYQEATSYGALGLRATFPSAISSAHSYAPPFPHACEPLNDYSHAHAFCRRPARPATGKHGQCAHTLAVPFARSAHSTSRARTLVRRRMPGSSQSHQSRVPAANCGRPFRP
jgi:hypothetical protein